MTFWDSLRQKLWPPRTLCLLCRRPMRGGEIELCRSCLARFPFLSGPSCRECGRPLRLAAVDGSRCRECLTHPHYFQRAWALGLYEGALREAIHLLKYCQQRELAVPLGRLLAEFWRQQGDDAIDLVMPVPLARERLKKRGFNQAELLAQVVAAELGLPLASDNLYRRRLTSQQSKLNGISRRQNVREAFAVKFPAEIAGKRVLIIDDVLTTGATASECARALLRAGALMVKVLTLATGVRTDQWLATGDV